MSLPAILDRDQQRCSVGKGPPPFCMQAAMQDTAEVAMRRSAQAARLMLQSAQQAAWDAEGWAASAALSASSAPQDMQA